MRAWVLVVLGGTVLYLVWIGFRPAGATASTDPRSEEEQAAGGAESGRATGRMLSVAEMEAALAKEDPSQLADSAKAQPDNASPAPGEDPKPAALGEAPAVARSEDAEAVQDPPELDWNLGDPVAEGRLLVHEVQRLPEYLEGEGRQLSEGRKSLLFGYGLLVRGLPEHAARHRAVIESSPDVTAAERDLFVAVLEGEAVRALPASGSRPSGLLLGVQMALLDREAGELLRTQQFRGAAEALSSLLLAEIAAPWPAEPETLARWSRDLATAQARHRWDRSGEWPSIEAEVQRGDSLVTVRKRVIDARPDLNLCTGLLGRANQIGQYLQPGPLRIPTAPVSVLVDLSARWIFYLHGDEVVAAWQVAIGKDEKTTPGRYTVGEKLEDPPWFQPGREMVPFGDPENPLGTRWIAWEGSNGLGFHGTWEPETIGSAASEGCIRMRNADVEELFEILPRGAAVEVQP